jgi:hypothetical protein
MTHFSYHFFRGGGGILFLLVELTVNIARRKTLKTCVLITSKNFASGLELVSCELLANPAGVADILVLNVHKTPS